MKRFIVIFMTLCLVLGMSSVSAGAATVGNQLAQAEIGWMRYNDTDSKIITNSVSVADPKAFGGSYIALYNKEEYVKFKFLGSKLRIITANNTSAPGGEFKITIDGKADRFSTSGPLKYSVLTYEKSDLDYGIHDVTIYNPAGQYYLWLEAIDIDDNGKLLQYNSTAKLSILLNEGENVQLSTSYNLDNNKTFTWSSTNESVATVDANGKVTAVAEGTADIYAQNADGTFKEYIPVKVVKGIADELRLAVHLKAGETSNLYLTADPSKVTWSSMDNSIATVSADGKVTGVKKGLAIIKGELEGKSYQIYVRVNG